MSLRNLQNMDLGPPLNLILQRSRSQFLEYDDVCSLYDRHHAGGPLPISTILPGPGRGPEPIFSEGIFLYHEPYFCDNYKWIRVREPKRKNCRSLNLGEGIGTTNARLSLPNNGGMFLRRTHHDTRVQNVVRPALVHYLSVLAETDDDNDPPEEKSDQDDDKDPPEEESDQDNDKDPLEEESDQDDPDYKPPPHMPDLSLRRSPGVRLRPRPGVGDLHCFHLRDMSSLSAKLFHDKEILLRIHSHEGKVHPEGKQVVDIDRRIDIAKISPSTRVTLRNDCYVLHMVLPSKVDPLVNLMRVEKVPDSTYDRIGGLDQQTKEGLLLYGPPGTGMTLLARAVAHHTDCTFTRVSGSELVHIYIGEGSTTVRELFVVARKYSPSLIFMDEVNSIGSGSGNGDSEVQRTMILFQLDGCEASNKTKVLMRIDILDQALLRPGRIDRTIEFPNPNEESRFDILKFHSRVGLNTEKLHLSLSCSLSTICVSLMLLVGYCGQEKMNNASGAELKAVFALWEKGVMKLEVTKFRPREVVKHVLQTAAASLKKALTLEGSIADDVPIEVVGDVLRIRQIRK